MSSGIKESEGVRFVTNPRASICVSLACKRSTAFDNVARRPYWKDRACLDLHDSYGIVVEHGRHVFRGELVGGVGDQQAGFANGTVPNDYAPR